MAYSKVIRHFKIAHCIKRFTRPIVVWFAAGADSTAVKLFFCIGLCRISAVAAVTLVLDPIDIVQTIRRVFNIMYESTLLGQATRDIFGAVLNLTIVPRVSTVGNYLASNRFCKKCRYDWFVAVLDANLKSFNDVRSACLYVKRYLSAVAASVSRTDSDTSRFQQYPSKHGIKQILLLTDIQYGLVFDISTIACVISLDRKCNCVFVIMLAFAGYNRNTSAAKHMRLFTETPRTSESTLLCTFT